MNLLTMPWRKFLVELNATQDEAALWEALNQERQAGRRINVMVRIYQRASKLRRSREHRDLFAESANG